MLEDRLNKARSIVVCQADRNASIKEKYSQTYGNLRKVSDERSGQIPEHYIETGLLEMILKSTKDKITKKEAEYKSLFSEFKNILRQIRANEIEEQNFRDSLGE
ncbi:hypothetical protein F4703DRAFT_1794256 [Phycomyces blakesleeanus]|uniref:Uncharacterized protein n=1 Tax=Phycomyces blakesleeanus (strain ATCC 8743b / DSM 1359 / FGSC 10004 / NBRC 33097 / NRRL 1555) TaxID=763407 RepID=A0A162PJL6_PHYB8|nr:hypothetical protein PHYBLDRAFT_145878 [Phycomyces blakesleeanus NRRL 1555(-)]OAD73487.1 hypothetical protein PHYBLDRAFT_145878 [Phycomyces blakesleeanus NRRL 1555(-)]|eukprot:XP_018291527.1 hypothetical protein PHYBLDRAFT_145878 [Phycomyces blakesleeanus NRRL 1555(-)]